MSYAIKFPCLVAGLLCAGSAIAAHGFLKGESPQGLSKICFYDVVGETYALNVKAFELCPISYDFNTAMTGGSVQPRSPNAGWSVNQEIARGFGDQISKLGTAYQDARDKQRGIESELQAAELENQRHALEVERKRLELENLKGETATVPDPSAEDEGMIGCTFPEPSPAGEWTPPPNIYVRIRNSQLFTLIRGEWTGLPSTVTEGILEVSGPFVAQTSTGGVISIEPAHLRIDRFTGAASLAPMGPTVTGAADNAAVAPFSGKCESLRRQF